MRGDPRRAPQGRAAKKPRLFPKTARFVLNRPFLRSADGRSSASDFQKPALRAATAAGFPRSAEGQRRDRSQARKVPAVLPNDAFSQMFKTYERRVVKTHII